MGIITRHRVVMMARIRLRFEQDHKNTKDILDIKKYFKYKGFKKG